MSHLLIKTYSFQNKYHKTVTFNRMNDLYQKKKLCDVEITLKNHKYKAHCLVLSSVSEYFNHRLVDDSEIPTLKQISFDNLDHEATKRILDYCYTGEIELSFETVHKILAVADLFLLQPVVKSCCDFMIETIDVENCLKLDKTIQLYGFPDLDEKFNDFIMNNYKKVSQTKDFLKLSADRLQRILKMDLTVSSERDIFDSIKAWVTHDMPNRKTHLIDLLKLAKLTMLSNEVIFNEVQPFCENMPNSRQFLINLLESKHSPGKTSLTTDCDPPPTIETLLLVAGADSEKSSRIAYYNTIMNGWVTFILTYVYKRNSMYGKIGDELYAIGGEDDKIRNSMLGVHVKTLVKRALPSLNVARAGAVVASIDKTLYVFGGYDESKTLNSVERWEYNDTKWTLTTPMITGRRGCGIAILDHEIYVIGGWNESSKDDAAYNIVEIFDTRTQKWRTGTPMNTERNFLSATVLDGKIYAFGGRRKGDIKSEAFKSVEYYSKSENKWTFTTDMTYPRYGLSSGVLYKQLVVAGGSNDDALGTFEIYDSHKKKWTRLSDLGETRENSILYPQAISAPVIQYI